MNDLFINITTRHHTTTLTALMFDIRDALSHSEVFEYGYHQSDSTNAFWHLTLWLKRRTVRRVWTFKTARLEHHRLNSSIDTPWGDAPVLCAKTVYAMATIKEPSRTLAPHLQGALGLTSAARVLLL